MTGTYPLHAPDRRLGGVERRQLRERRAHAVPGLDIAEENKILRELLGEAHERIRLLEQALEQLRRTI
jgi:hypothetical protein